MDDLAATEERLFKEKLSQKIKEVAREAEKHFSPIREHVIFNVEKAHQECVRECFDKNRRTDEGISSCIKSCADVRGSARQIYTKEIAKYQERVNISFKACRDNFNAAKLQKKTEALNDAVSCIDESGNDHINMLPHLADLLRASIGMKGDD